MELRRKKTGLCELPFFLISPCRPFQARMRVARRRTPGAAYRMPYRQKAGDLYAEGATADGPRYMAVASPRCPDGGPLMTSSRALGHPVHQDLCADSSGPTWFMGLITPWSTGKPPGTPWDRSMATSVPGVRHHADHIPSAGEAQMGQRPPDGEVSGTPGSSEQCVWPPKMAAAKASASRREAQQVEGPDVGGLPPIPGSLRNCSTKVLQRCGKYSSASTPSAPAIRLGIVPARRKPPTCPPPDVDAVPDDHLGCHRTTAAVHSKLTGRISLGQSQSRIGAKLWASCPP